MDIPEVTVEELIDRYAVLLLDSYGVLVTSGSALPGAGAFVERLDRVGKPYFLLTNGASKLPTTAAARFRRYGLAIDEARFIASVQLLPGYFARHGLAGTRAVVLGTADSVVYVARAGGRPVSPDDESDVVVVADDRGSCGLANRSRRSSKRRSDAAGRATWS